MKEHRGSRPFAWQGPGVGPFVSVVALIVACGKSSRQSNDEDTATGADGGKGGTGSSKGGAGGTTSGSGGAATGGAAPSGGGAGGAGKGGSGSSGEAGAGVGGDAGAGGSPSDECERESSSRCNPSCQGMLGTECAGRDCCESLVVPGGTFYRSYDGVSTGFMSQDFPATVSAFRLDAFEITVGRFRNFITAWLDDGWRPPAYGGKHVHLNAGSGLAAVEGGFEPGWDPRWNDSFPTDREDWATWLSDSGAYWTPEGTDEANHVADTITWLEAFALCIWDGGFLPSEAEWNFAAAGGAEQRAYPWSNPPTSLGIDCTHAMITGCTGTLAVGARPAGNGRYGHADLAASTYEFVLDTAAVYAPTCIDCADFSIDATRRVRGGASLSALEAMLSSARAGGYAGVRHTYFGARCARRP